MRQVDSSDSTVQQPAENAADSVRFSPLRFLIITIGGIFVAEVIAMFVLTRFRAWPYVLQTILDASLMVVLIFPVIYYFSMRPLLLQIEKRRQAENALLQAYDEMDLRVQARTEELRVANSELEEEIHVRRQAEKALRQSEQRLSRAEEIAHLGSWELDLRNNRLNWSDEAYRIFGLQPQAFAATYEAFLEAVHPDDRAAVDEAYLGSIRDGRDTYEFEHRIVRHLSGEVRIVQEKCEHFRDDKGQIVRSVGMVHDITERKNVEKQLERSHQKLNEILASIQDDFYVLDRNWKFIYASRLFTSKIGKEPEDVIGNNIWEMFPKHVGTVLEENFRGAMEQRQTRRFEVGGKYTSAWYRMTAFPSPEGITVIGTDITERKQTEEALEKSEAMLRAVLNQMPSGVTVRDAFTGELILSNPRGVEILGNLVETTDQLADYHGLHADGSFYRSEEWPLFRSITVGEKVDAEEIELEGHDGTHKTISISSAPIQDSQGQITSGVAVFHDVTERKKAEQELKQLNRTLQAHNASSHAMLRALREEELLDEVCKVIVEICGHTMVWIGYAQEDEEKSVRPVASAGFDAGYLQTLKITWAESERGRGPTGTAIRTGKPQGCRNMLTDPQFAPWREPALQRGYASSLVLPLKTDGKAFGAMTIYARKPDAFSKDEENLLAELAGDLAHGIETIRLREAHERTTEALRESEERFRLALTHAPVTAAVQDRDLCYTWVYNQRTRDVNEIIGKTDVDLFPWEANHLTALKQRVMETGENVSEQLWVNSNNQRLFLDLFIEPLKNEKGEITGVGLATVDLSEIKQAEEQLRYQATLLSNVNDAIVASDAQFRVTAWNTAAESLYGWKADEVIGHNGLEIVRTAWSEQDGHEMRRTIAEKGRWRGEATQSHKDGTRFPVDVSSMVLYDDHGQITGYVSVNRDITARKQTEAALQASEAKYRDLFENMTEEVHFWQLVYDEAGNIQTWRLVDANPPTLKSWNRQAVDEIRGCTTDEIFGPGATDHYMPIVQKIMTEHIPYSYEDYFEHLDKYFRFTSVPLKDHFITTGADITSLKKAEQALRAARDELERRVEERTAELAVANRELLNEIKERRKIEHQLRIQTTAMEAAANGMVITDLRGTIEWANPAMTQISGYETHELIGREMRVLQSGKHAQDFYKELWQTILAGNVWRGETTNRRKDGNLYVEEQTITPVRDGNGQVSHFISIKQDVTERKLMYAQLEESNRELIAISTSEHQQRKIAEILSQASIALSQTLDIQHVMETILDYIQLVLPVDGAFLILSEGHDQYRVRCVRFREDQRLISHLLNQTIDLLTEPTIKPFFESPTSTLISDSRLLENWDPPAELSMMLTWLGLPLISGGKTIGMVVAINTQPGSFTKDQVDLAEAVVGQAAVALQNAWLFEQVRSGRQRLQLLSRHLVEIQENERKYIARELHDETSQTLTSLKLGLHSIEQTSGGEPLMVQQVAKLKNLADEILESLHRLAMNLRPASLDHLGLVEALTGLVHTTGEDSGLVTRFKTLGAAQRNRLTEDIESSLYRIVQESLTNIVRHAKASCADVILEWQEDQVTIIVEDDGIGIDSASRETAGHLGLVGMRERAEMLGGKFLVDSSPKAGTTLVVEIPYAN